MEPIYLSISPKETGSRIKKLLKENGYAVKDIQQAMGFENPQAVYKWISGKSLPSIDNFVILSRLLHTNIENILVIDGDVVLLNRFYLVSSIFCTSSNLGNIGVSVEPLKVSEISQASSGTIMAPTKHSSISKEKNGNCTCYPYDITGTDCSCKSGTK